jgi:plasmid replication initiation protein
MQDVLRLKRDYSIDLYHIFKKRQGESFREERNTFVITLDELKVELGLSKAYDRISNLKSRVIKPSIAEINKKTDVIVSYSDTKKGRTIIGFKFTVKPKPQPKKDNKDDIKAQNGDLFTIDGLSDAQLARITRSPDFIKDYSRRISPSSDMNKDMSLWTAHFVQELKKDASQFGKRPIREYLKY